MSEVGKTTFDVVGLGMVTLDILTSVPRLPQSNEVFGAQRIDMQGGGPVATALVALSRLGARTAYVGSIAPDLWGEIALKEFDRFGVDTHWVVQRDSGTSVVSVILVEPKKGARAILYEKGRLPQLTETEVPAELIQSARVLHLDGFHLPAALRAAEIARQAGVAVSLDGGAGQSWSRTRELLSLVDILVVARQFAQYITGYDDPEEAGPALQTYGASQVAITDGENGCWYWDANQHLFQPAFRVQVQDTTGAGDTFHGAYLYAWLQGWPPKCILEFASAVAALKCTQVGGRLGIPSLSQALDFLEQHKV